MYALIWTTTPWTLPGNVAVVYSPILSYSLVKIHDLPGTYLLATDLVQSLSVKIEKPINIITTIKGLFLSKIYQKFLFFFNLQNNNFPGLHLNGVKYKSLKSGESDKQFLAGDHVTTDKGTGLIHTAPAYGHEDFLIALKHNIPVVRIKEK